MYCRFGLIVLSVLSVASANAGFQSDASPMDQAYLMQDCFSKMDDMKTDNSFHGLSNYKPHAALYLGDVGKPNQGVVLVGTQMYKLVPVGNDVNANNNQVLMQAVQAKLNELNQFAQDLSKGTKVSNLRTVNNKDYSEEDVKEFSSSCRNALRDISSVAGPHPAFIKALQVFSDALADSRSTNRNQDSKASQAH